MTIKEILSELGQLQIKVNLAGENLDIIVPKGVVIPPALLAALKENKEEMIRFIHENSRDDKHIPILDSGSEFPLSSAQERLWILSQNEASSVAYNMPTILRFTGDFSIELFSESLKKVVERQESLRTVFRKGENHQPYQTILPAEEVSTVPEVKQITGDSEAISILEKWIQQPFDLVQGPLFRILLCRKSEQEHIMGFVMHHIISDGWSMDVFVAELLTGYNALKTGGEIVVPQLKAQYKDYAVWQKAQKKTDKYARDKAFWLQQLQGELPSIELPAQKTRPVVKTYNGSHYTYQFETGFFNRLEQYAAQRGGTLFVALSTVFNALIHKYTGQNDLVYGTPVAGRSHEDLKDLIGFFVNAMVLRTEVKGKDTLNSLFERTKKTIFEGLAANSYQFDELLEDLAPKRDRSRSPIFDIMLVLQNAVVSQSNSKDLSGIRAESVEVESPTSKFDMTWSFFTGNNGDQLHLEYNTDIYDKAFVAQMAEHFARLANVLLTNPQNSLEQLSCLSADDLKLVLQHLTNKGHYRKDLSIACAFTEQLQKTPSHIAVKSGDRLLTYEELDRLSTELAGYIQNKFAIVQEDVVGIRLERNEWLIIATLAVLKAGGAYLPLDDTYPEERINYLLEDSNCKGVIDHTCIEAFLKRSENYPLKDNTIHSDNLAYLMYTSGTTGLPKGVLIEQKSVLRLVKPCSFEDLNEEKCLLVTGSPAFDSVTFEYWSMLLNGGTLVMCPKEELLDPVRMKEIIRTENVNTMWLTASWFNQITDLDATLFAPLKTLLVGGDKLSAAHIKRIRKFYPDLKIINGYGPTENTTFSLCHNICRDEIEIPIGVPVGYSTAVILDGHRNPVPLEVTGELYVGGEGLARGYHNNPLLTETKFITHELVDGGKLYATGDLVKMSSDGLIHFQGRKDDQVKINGYRIEIGEIEQAMLSVEGIRNAVVIHIRKDLVNELRAFYTAESPISPKELKTALSGKLPKYMIPTACVQLNAIPLTENGKTDRAALLELDVQTESDTSFEELDATSATIAEIWSDVLGQSIRHTDADFFDMGGHSLKAVILAGELSKSFQCDIRVTDIFTHPQLSDQTELVKRAPRLTYQEIPKADQKEYYPLSSAQKRMLFLQEFEPESTSYTIPLYNFLGTEVDVERIENAIDSVISRHQSLHTRFIKKDGEASQKPEPGFKLQLEQYSCNADEITTMMKTINRPFDLFSKPPVRSVLIHINEIGYIWGIFIHHILSDGTSVELLSGDFLKAYHQQPLEPLRLNYIDFSEWQNERRDRGELVVQENYWKTKLKGSLPRLNLPADRLRPATFTFEGDLFSVSLDAETNKRLKEHMSQNGVTLQMVMLTALNILFYKYSAQEDILLGCSVANRTHPDLRQVTGMFVNSLVMRNSPEADKRITDFQQEVKQTSLEAFENQDVQFEDLVDLLNVERNPAYNPVFDVSLVIQNFDRFESEFGLIHELPAAVTKTLDELNRTSKFDLTWFISETADALEIQIEYYSAVFNQSTIERFLTHFRMILTEIIEHPERMIGHINLSSGDTCLDEQILSGPTLQIEESLIGRFERMVETNPDEPAIRSNNVVLTYRELDVRVNRFSKFLHSYFRDEQSPVIAVLQDKNVSAIVSMLSAIKAGVTYVPLDPEYPENRLQFMLEDSGATLLVTDSEFVEFGNRLLWRCKGLRGMICPDSDDIGSVKEGFTNDLMRRDLWDHVGETAQDLIAGGGWVSSYTGELISELEMQEYSDNIYRKLTEIIQPEMRILEIGCSSGLTMFRLAPLVKSYHGVDLSPVIVKNTREEAQKRGATNVVVECFAAHEIDRLDVADFDIVILNSVIHCFSGHNYLHDVLRKAISLMKPKGYLFLGDLMDEERREELIADLVRFKEQKTEYAHNTKTDWSSELFIHKDFLRDLLLDQLGCAKVSFSDKYHTVENELTRFRYDALLEVNQNAATFSGTRSKVLFDLREIDRFDEQNWSNPQTGDNPAYIIYTSGSTGTPKGVVISYNSMDNYLFWASEYYAPKPGYRFHTGLFSSLSFDLTVTSIYLPLMTGGSVTTFERQLETGEILSRYFDPKNGMNTIKLTPSHIILAHNLGIRNSALEIAIVGGEALNVFHTEMLLEIAQGITIYNEYGPTEATVGCMVWEYNQGSDIFIGKPVANTRIMLLDEEGLPVPAAIIGEIAIGGDQLAIGYKNRPDLTKERFTNLRFGSNERIYLTGDLARLNSSGMLEYRGRKDTQVKIRGYRIELSEIEQIIARLEGVKTVVVTTVNHNDEMDLVAYIVPSDGFEMMRMRQKLAELLPAYMIPNYFQTIDKLPLTVNGKLDKSALPDIQRDSSSEEFPYMSPENPVEEKMVEIWKKVLQANHISTTADFFLIGGHSLRATRLITLYEQEFGVKLSLKSVFANTTIRKQAELISTGEKSTFSAISKAVEKPYYEPSSAQKRLYFLNEMAPDSTSYNMPLVQFLGKNVDKDRVGKIYNTLLCRHEGMRTSFIKIDGEPYQQIHDNVEGIVEYYECTSEHFKEVAVKFVRPFDLSKAPLSRLALIHIQDMGYAIIIDEHHIMSDGTSHQMITDEFLKLYLGEVLEEPKLQYRDFSEWQNALFRSGEIEKQRDYWKSQYADGVPTINMPLDKPRPKSFTFEGDRTSLNLGVERTAAIRKIGEKYGATLQMTLLSVINVVLHKWSGQEDIVVGCGIAGRRHAELEKVYGMFVNSLAIRNKPEKHLEFETFYKRVIDKSLDAYDNQDVQFEDLVDTLLDERDPGRNPVFDILLVVQNFERSRMLLQGKIFNEELANGSIEDVSYENYTSKFDMTIFAWESEEDISLQIEFYSAVYHKATINEFLQQVNRAIDVIVDDICIPIKEINLLSEKGKKTILEEFGKGLQVTIAPDQTVHGVFSLQAYNTPEAIAVSDEHEHVSYRDLNEQANQLGNFLLNTIKLAPEECVGILQYRNIGLITSQLGILKAGGAYVPLDPSLPEERLLFLLEDAGIQTLLAEKTLIGLATKLQWRSDKLKHIVCINSHNIYQEHGGVLNQLTQKELWDHVGDTAGTDIEAGGWLSSYTGQPISDLEMKEYSENAYLKLQPYLRKDMTVLEVGCSSGLTMFRVASDVRHYVGTDLSSGILAKTGLRKEELGIHNISLHCLPAHEINTLNDRTYDLVIINSVIQCFEDHNYLLDVLNKAVSMMNDGGLIFLGDIMDEAKRKDLIDELVKFKSENQGMNYRTKIDWSSELFISREFLRDFQLEHPFLESVNFSEKIKTIDNELTKFRYDAIIKVNKQSVSDQGSKSKNQFDKRHIDAMESTEPLASCGKSNLCYVMYTSGSTGTPKGVMIEHKSVLRLVTNDAIVPLTSSDCMLATGASSFDATTFEYWGMLLNGGKLVLREKEDLLNPSTMKEIIKREKVTKMWFTAGWLHELTDNEIGVFDGLETVIAGGDKLSVRHLKKLKEYYPDLQLINGYGPTENTTFSLTHTITQLDSFSVAIGKPVANSRVFIVDENNRPVPIGVTGELVFGGEGIARAYLNAPELTAAKFGNCDLSDGILYWSGDLGRWRTNGDVEFAGRKDDQLKIRGFRIEPAEIETVLRQLPEVEDVRIIKHPDHELLIAFLTLAYGKKKVDTLRDELHQLLPQHMVPDQLYILDKLPLNANGKVDGKALIAELRRKEKKTNNTIVSSQLQQQIMEIWCTVLGKETIDPKDDFFTIGGHSLKAISLVSAFEKAFGKKVALQDIFDKSTVLEQMTLFDQAEHNKQHNVLEKVIEVWKSVLGKSSVESTDDFFQIGGHSLKAITLISSFEKAFGKRITLQEVFDHTTPIAQVGLFQQNDNDVIEKIRSIWMEVLNKDDVQTDDDFFTIGGHSLKAISLISAFNKAFSTKISLQDVFSHTTIESQAFLFANTKSVDGFEQIPSASVMEDYPASHAQKRMWVLSRFEESSAAYNMPFQVGFDLDFNPEAFQEALNHLVKRHEILRTTFFENPNGEIRQKIHPAADYPLTLEQRDLSRNSSAMQIAQSEITADTYRLFDLENGPLARGVIYQLPESFLVYFNMHHSISDGWSMEVLRKELMGIYNAILKSELIEKVPLRVQYKDYAVWQQDQLNNGKSNAAKVFWLEQLNGELPRIDLPGKSSRPQVKTNNGHAFITYFDASLSKLAEKAANENGQSLFSLLLAFTNVLLYKYTSITDILVGAPVAGRGHDDLKDQLGLYVNTIVLRNKLNPEKSFQKFAETVSRNTIDALEHESYPFDLLVEELNLPHEPSRNPIFDVMVTLQNVLDLGDDLPGEIVLNDIVSLGRRNNLFDLEFSFRKVQDVIEYRIDFNTDIYDEEMIIALMKNSKELLKNLLTQQHIAIGRLSAVAQDEQKRLINYAGTERIESYHSVLDMLKQQTTLSPDKTALICNEHRYSYAELEEVTNQLAQFLSSAGKVNPGDIIALKLDRSEWLVIGMLAAFKLNAAYLPLDTNYPEDRLNYMEADSGCKYVLTENRLADFLASQTNHPSGNETAYRRNEADELAYIIYTSGSTGKPKGVLISHAALSDYVRTAIDGYSITSADIVLQQSSVSFDIAVEEVFPILCAGGTLVLSKEGVLNLNKLLEELNDHHVTVMSATPLVINELNVLCEVNGTFAPSLRLLISGGDELKPTFLSNLFGKVAIFNTYGPTESTVCATYHEVKQLNQAGYIGKPIPNRKVYVLDDYLQLVPQGVIGELYIGGKGLAQGYLNNPELTREVFIDNPFEPGQLLYKTGDYVKWSKDGQLQFAGRRDSQSKIAGYRIELGEISNALLLIDAVKQAESIVIGDEASRRIVSFVILNETFGSEQLDYYLRGVLPHFMVPSQIIILEEFPVTINGKSDLRKLEEIAGSLASADKFLEPQNETEAEILLLWKQVLNKDRIGVRDDFFALGGNSLKAIRLLTLIEKEMGLNLKIADIYLRRTIEDLAMLITHKKWLVSEDNSLDVQSEDFLI